MTADIPKALAFYGRVFGWKSKAMDMGPMGTTGTYQMLSAGGVDFGGIMPFAEGNPHWMPYVSVANIDAACKTTEREGGVVCVPPFQIPNVGRFAVVADPLGAVSSPLQMDNPPTTDPDAPPGVGLVAWNELVTPEPAKVGGFYGKVYGWKLGEMDMGPMGTYHLFKDGAKDVAGMMKTPPNVPPGTRPQWLAYVHVTDVDGTLANAVSAGGQVGAPAFDVPGVGRLAIFSDPAGAMIALFKPSAQ
jgi:predicted enzyme related to lactoylglutathione lyase